MIPKIESVLPQEPMDEVFITSDGQVWLSERNAGQPILAKSFAIDRCQQVLFKSAANVVALVIWFW
jgi:hypothetical protein